MKPAGDNALFALGEPKACEWLTDYLSRCIADWGIDIYRNDFNIDPLPFWQAADAPDRQGMAEIRYIENLYTMWDDLRRRKPGLTIDNCASGGRRIDLETISRSYPLWQSDTQCCGKPMPVWDQVQNAGLSLYVPLHSAGVWAFDPYQFRSIATTGTSICSASTDKETLAQARKMTDQEKLLRPLYLGDYYPLFETTLNEHDWCGWQYDRPESGAGFALLFRRDRSPYTAVDVQLRGLDSGSSYTVENVDTGEKRTLTGEAMSKQFKVEIPEAPGSVLMRYQKVR
jgi:alpha-galactosidase